MKAVDAASIPPPTSEADEDPESSSRAGVARALVRACETELQQSPDPRRAARLHFEAARLLEVPLWDFGAAVEHYEASRKLWPEHVPTLRGLRRVQTALGRYSSVPSLLDSEIRSRGTPRGVPSCSTKRAASSATTWRTTEALAQHSPPPSTWTRAT